VIPGLFNERFKKRDWMVFVGTSRIPIWQRSAHPASSSLLEFLRLYYNRDEGKVDNRRERESFEGEVEPEAGG
jgi:hypothetical protein